MNYTPIKEVDKDKWIAWLQSQQSVLDGKSEDTNNTVFETPEGDVATAKDLVGNLLALLTNQTVTIN